MSVQAVAASGAGASNDAAQAAARVAELQQLIEQAASGFDPASSTAGTGSSAASSSDFSTMLASAASASGTSAAAGTSAADPSAGGYASIIDAAAAQYGLNPAVLTGLVHQESGFNASAVSSAGAEGLTQVMPENFAADGITNPFDPTQSIDGGAKQLSEDLQEFGGNYTDALAAYNAGSAAVQQYGGVPPYAQTENYVQDVLAYAQQVEGQEQPATSLTTPTAEVAT